jgi:hypothetical protein
MELMQRQAAKSGIQAIPYSERPLGFFDTFVLWAVYGPARDGKTVVSC